MGKFNYIAALVCTICVFFTCFMLLTKVELKSDVGQLYYRRYAFMSYLSIMGIEGIAQSKYFFKAATPELIHSKVGS